MGLANKSGCLKFVRCHYFSHKGRRILRHLRPSIVELKLHFNQVISCGVKLQILSGTLLFLIGLISVISSNAFAQGCDLNRSVFEQSLPTLNDLKFDALSVVQASTWERENDLYSLADIFDYTKIESRSEKRLGRSMNQVQKRVYTTDYLNNVIRGTASLSGKHLVKGDPAVIIGYSDDSSADPDEALNTLKKKFDELRPYTVSELQTVAALYDSTHLRAIQSNESVEKFGRLIRVELSRDNMATKRLVFEKVTFLKDSDTGIYQGTDGQGHKLRLVAPAPSNG